MESPDAVFSTCRGKSRALTAPNSCTQQEQYHGLTTPFTVELVETDSTRYVPPSRVDVAGPPQPPQDIALSHTLYLIMYYSYFPLFVLEQIFGFKGKTFEVDR